MTDTTLTKAHPIVGVIGGTGDLGKGICMRAAAAGYEIVVGSRSDEKAKAAASEITAQVDGAVVSGADYSATAQTADLVILAVPYAAHGEALEAIRDHMDGKIVVDATVPLNPPKVMRVQLPEKGIAAEQTRQVLGDNVKVTAAFHSIAAAKLLDLGMKIECDLLVFGDEPEAREQVVQLGTDMGLTSWHAGPLPNAVIGEALTSTLIFINKKYKIKSAGIRISGEMSE